MSVAGTILTAALVAILINSVIVVCCAVYARRAVRRMLSPSKAMQFPSAWPGSTPQFTDESATNPYRFTQTERVGGSIPAKGQHTP